MFNVFFVSEDEVPMNKFHRAKFVFTLCKMICGEGMPKQTMMLWQSQRKVLLL